MRYRMYILCLFITLLHSLTFVQCYTMGFDMMCYRCNCSPGRGSVTCIPNHVRIDGPLPDMPYGLMELKLDSANVTALSESSLPNTVWFLSLRSNALTSLPQSGAGLPLRLVTVDLYNNSLTSLGDLTILPNIQHIDVTDNSVNVLPGASSWSPSLVDLQISSNNVEIIEDLSQSRLLAIEAHRNNISAIGKLPASLEKLSIPWNQVTSLDFLQRNYLPNLYYLDVYENKNFDLNQALTQLRLHNYNNMAIKDLKVGGDTKTIEFPFQICTMFPGLEKLSFYNGKLQGINTGDSNTDVVQSVDIESLTPCLSLRTLNLHGNPLSRGINVELIQHLFPNLHFLTLSSSLVRCSCDLYNYIKDRNITVEYSSEHARCGSPSPWTGFSLRHNTPPVNCSAPPSTHKRPPTETPAGDTNNADQPSVRPQTPVVGGVQFVMYAVGATVLLVAVVFLVVVVSYHRIRKQNSMDKDTEIATKDAVPPKPPCRPKESFDSGCSVNSGSINKDPASSDRKRMKLPRNLTHPDDFVLPLSQRRKFTDIKYDEAQYLMSVNERVRLAAAERPESGVYENDTNEPHHYLELDELGLSVAAEEAYSHAKYSPSDRSATYEEAKTEANGVLLHQTKDERPHCMSILSEKPRVGLTEKPSNEQIHDGHHPHNETTDLPAISQTTEDLANQTEIETILSQCIPYDVPTAQHKHVTGSTITDRNGNALSQRKDLSVPNGLIHCKQVNPAMNSLPDYRESTWQ